MATEESPQAEEQKWDRWDKRLRDITLFLVGIAGVINELWIEETPRLYSLIFLGSILGIPFALRADEKRRGGG
jgi:hypothetical protein